MGKNKNTPPSPTAAATANSTMEAQMAALQATMNQIVGKLDEQSGKLSVVERSLHELRVENAAVREELAAARSELIKKDEIIVKLTDQVNRLDQQSRSSSVRIIGLQVSTDTPPGDVAKVVFNEILTPILRKAIEVGDLPATFTIPHHSHIINEAFVIPAKKGSSCPVIVKFPFQNIRSLLFKHKKTALPTFRDLPSNKIRNKFSVFEDLTPSTHAHLRTITSDPRVRSAWSYNGQIRFKIQDSETIYRVKALGDSVDSLVKAPPTGPTAMSP
jgi:hypothetical protein